MAPTPDISEFQVVDSMLFHEFAIVDKIIVRVTVWFPPSRLPDVEGRYQGLVKSASGEQYIEDFYWDGYAWKNIRTGRFTRKKFYWRGLAANPEDE